MTAVSDAVLPYVEAHCICIIVGLKHFHGSSPISLREKTIKNFLTQPLSVNSDSFTVF